MFVKPSIFLAYGLGFLILPACTSKDKSNQGYKVKMELLRMSGASYGVSRQPSLGLVPDNDRYAWTSNIDIKSLKLPIRAITLSEMTGDSGTKNPQTLYSCDTDCDVDLLGPELTNLLADKTVDVKGTGTFQQISVSFGEGATNWDGKITAEFTLGGQKYYTKSSGAPSTTGPAEESTYTGFGGGSISYLPSPLVLEAQDSEKPSDAKPLTIKLYFDALYSAFAVDSSKVSPVAHPGGFCVGDMNASEITLCTQRLVVAASTQTATPTRERYTINEASLATLYFDNGTSPLGGSLRQVLNEGYPNRGTVNDVDLTEPGTNGAEVKSWASAPVFGFSENTDGTFLLSTTIGEPNDANENGGFRAKAFKRETHDGAYETSQGKEYSYSAVKSAE
ncbi:MAG TPA: hypothetical protein VE954_21050 [Oligoflexus sp.]|uniref:hypothetical protein n=1 Tax=Oligoflexus sp. TaxID=1971216 RepID=UPI002D716916|nr:hypothetical protein [Oligoflexus sp.]HYX35593.1 hypothetical protein [Oligoflexus sp.]